MIKTENKQLRKRQCNYVPHGFREILEVQKKSNGCTGWSTK